MLHVIGILYVPTAHGVQRIRRTRTPGCTGQVRFTDYDGLWPILRVLQFFGPPEKRILKGDLNDQFMVFTNATVFDVYFSIRAFLEISIRSNGNRYSNETFCIDIITLSDRRWGPVSRRLSLCGFRKSALCSILHNNFTLV